MIFLKLSGQAIIVSKSVYQDKKTGETYQIVTLGDAVAFEKMTFFRVSLDVSIPEPRTSVQYEVTLREYKNKQGYNQLACYLNEITPVA